MERPRQKQRSHPNNVLPAIEASEELMGPIIRRKKVVSMPLGGGDAFFGAAMADHHHQQQTQTRKKQNSDGTKMLDMVGGTATPTPRPLRHRDFVTGVLNRKQVSMDVLSPDYATFFGAAVAEEGEAMDPPGTGILATDEKGNKVLLDEENEPTSPGEVQAQEAARAWEERRQKLWRPLKFAPRLLVHHLGGKGGGHGGSGHPSSSGGGADASDVLDDETRALVQEQVSNAAALHMEVRMLPGPLSELRKADTAISDGAAALLKKVTPKHKTDFSKRDGSEDEEEQDDEDFDDSFIVRAQRRDYITTAIIALIMMAFTITCCVWETHVDEDASIFGPVGLSCVTPCHGDLETQDFFRGHSSFKAGHYIELLMHLDANHDETAYAEVHIVGVESNETKSITKLGPANPEVRLTLQKYVKVDFNNPEEHHVINVVSVTADGDAEHPKLTFSLHTGMLSGLHEHSVWIAAVILILAYLFIMLEVIHRTLVAIFASMVALFFVFLMHMGETEAIGTIMLEMEWSTLGLLFGMMLIVGELSHTGVFEWLAVRLLVASNGSFVKLFLLLSTLTAVASAFLDNVTTMLLIAPVTIDMCTILQVDPRPYLITEVLLSNIGGTATLIGDPPNIIIGSSIPEVDFVDFIIHIMPCVFFLLIPVSLFLSTKLFDFYLSSQKMPDVSARKLKLTYQIYDEPRLLIAGTVAFFVILLFFLHPIHHKDTAWIALIGAFVTMAFTNPHDVQTALTSHVEWDTLLFFAGLFVLVESCAALGLLAYIGDLLSSYIADQPEAQQKQIAITLIMWVSAIASAFIDNIPWTATMIPIIQILATELNTTLDIETLAWALSFGACLGGNGTLLGASANIVTAGIATNKGYVISFSNFSFVGMVVMIVTVVIANLYMLVRYAWV